MTENHLRIFSLFTNGIGRECYIREVGNLLHISPRTAQLILDDLEKKTVLESKTLGKIKVYSIKKTAVAKEYLILAEEYKKIAFLASDALLREIVSNVIPHIRGIGIIFGSYAKHLQKKDSDIDIFVIGTHDKEEIRKVSATYGIKISVKMYPPSVFKKNIRHDVLVREVLDAHIVISGVEAFVEAEWGWIN